MLALPPVRPPIPAGGLMSLYKPQQRHLKVRNRELHFVSYEAHPADVRHNADAQPEMWYLMQAGRRWAVMPRDPEQPAEVTDEVLRAWAEENAFGAEVPTPEPAAIVRPRRRGRDSWWGSDEGRQGT
ncbi:MAG TPA: hypothetical protein PK948_08525 [Gemmatimonadales bacterium]|nr:hypothetical protein [Gemmatimonadales bacterium]